ncbi:DNA recombination protein RmuC [Sulfurospirillum arcachonense]|uniref:DNA recombination protein RmuC n=1 Tax=Sulfurospirillum arcachonense TaxID=57666 RepID=UPI000468C9B4|nr:DNA recombination protein RmuC [Sulfurospirillum arcachonense]
MQIDNTVLLFVLIGITLISALTIVFLIKNLFEKQKEFLYTKIEQIDRRVLENAKNTTSQIEKNAELFIKISNSQQLMRNEQQKSLYEMSKEIKEQSSKDMEKLSLKVEENLQNINEKVEKRLEKGFENIDKTFKDIIVGIAKIGEAQKKIETLSTDVNSLQNVLTDKKSRGIFGEVQLGSILNSIFGEKRDLYDLQYSFTSGVIVDAVVKAPEPLGLIGIDSKFPMENYTRMVEDKTFTSDFRQNIKKHVNDIASKYIIKGTTADMAILFLPAEAIFAEINAYHEELIDYARKKGVWIASPTTIMALLTTITAIVRDIKTQEQAKKIQEELLKLSSNFKLYKKRWDNLSKHIETVNKDVKEITTSTNKISNEFERIERVEFEDDIKLPL